MAKRFTDTEKWKKLWFRKLSPYHKCFWLYVIDNCNHAGIWNVDFELAEFMIGKDINIDDLKKCFNKQFEEIDNGKKWFIKDFVSFQYSELNFDNRVHRSVIDILKKEGVYKPLVRGIQGCKDKDKDKNKDKDKYMLRNFEEIWRRYPKRDGKKEAFRHYKKSVKNEKDKENINIALDNYLKSKVVKDGFIKNGSTWFNNWEDWIENNSEHVNINSLKNFPEEE